MQLDDLPERVWLKGHNITHTNELGHLKWPLDVWRRNDYGNRASEHGWEIDHIQPVAGVDNNAIGNLRPLNWHNNVGRN